jgi:uncharacterized protein with ATP-grasp and redox domains
VIEETLRSDFAVNDYALFKKHLEQAARIVYLGDNVGEIVFDRILIETLLKRRTFDVGFVVRGMPIINDATLEDAWFVGLDQIVRVISNGSDAPATVLSECSPEMLEVYRGADLVIVKGQGSYESLSEEQGPLFFLLRAKCAMVARDLGVEVDDIILKAGKDVPRDVQAEDPYQQERV